MLTADGTFRGWRLTSCLASLASRSTKNRPPGSSLLNLRSRRGLTESYEWPGPSGVNQWCRSRAADRALTSDPRRWPLEGGVSTVYGLFASEWGEGLPPAAVGP